MSKKLRIFIMAGEPSGDKLGANLMRGLQKLTKGQVEFQGVGGAMMQEAGLNSLFDMSDLSIMGLFEIIPSIPKLLKRIAQTKDAALNMAPDAVISIDSPDFCLRVGRKIKQVRTDQLMIHYVAPSVWAWRPERGAKMAKTIDHVLALLPFEPPLMKKEGMSCDFVGHPTVTEDMPNLDVQRAVLADLGLTPDDEILTLLPGSRRSEIDRMLPIYLQAVQAVQKQRPNLRCVLPAALSVVDQIKQKLAQSDVPVVVLDPTKIAPFEAEQRKRAIYAASRVALATSGTIALDLAKQRCPMVIAYRANWATTRAVKKLAQTDRANLINIVTASYIVPELMFEKCTVENTANEVLSLLENPVKRAAQITACSDAMAKLGEGMAGFDTIAARSVIKAINP